MRGRLADAQSIRDVAQVAADFYVKDGDDDTCVVGVVRGETGEPVFGCAGGADEHSLYRIASLSKMFLYPVLLQMHADGRIDLGGGPVDFLIGDRLLVLSGSDGTEVYARDDAA